MSEMIDRVARALYLHDGGDEEDWEMIVTDRWTARARAAIEAMRIPTPRMSASVQAKHAPHQGGVSVVWMDMIDAALTKPSAAALTKPT